MKTFTFKLPEAEAATLEDLARLVGQDDSSFVQAVVRSYVQKQASDPDVEAALRGIHKLRAATQPPAAAPQTPALGSQKSRVAQGRSLANLPNGLEVSFLGKRGRMRNGRLDVGGVVFTTPSRAAVHVAGGGSYNGWVAWKDDTGRTLAEIYQQYAASK